MGRLRDRLCFGFATLALATSVLSVGGAHRITQAIVALLVAAALLSQIFARRKLDRVSPLVVLLGIATALTLVQLVPLPEGVREWLYPKGESLRVDGAEISGTSPWPSLSLDPAGTLRALVYFLTLLGVAVVSLRFSASEKGRYALLVAVAGTCGLAALVTGAHTLANADSLYGIYDPVHASPPVLGPLLNSNHLGSLMSLGAVLSVGLAMYARQAVQLRVVWILNALGCVLVLVATLSRGAVLALAFGLAIAAAAMVARRFEQSSSAPNGRRRRSSAMTSQLPIAIIIAFGLGLVVYSSAGTVASQLDNTSLTELGQPSSKYAAWKSSVQLIGEAPWTGIGRGALEPVFTRVHEPAAYVTFSHLENEYLQAVVEWGIPGALLLAGALGWCIVRAFRRWRESALAAAALGGVAGVLLQSMVDFGVELIGLAVPLTIVAATVLVVPLRETSAPTRTRLIRGGLIGALVVGALLVLQPFARSVLEDHDDLLADPRATTFDQVQASIQRHPMDYFGYGQAAGMLMRENDARAAKYLNHAMELHPTHPGLHRLVARVLVATNRKPQAAVQFALALKGTTTPKKLIEEILVLMPRPDDASRALPTSVETVEIIYKALSELKRTDVMLRWLARVIAVPQKNVLQIDKLYNLAMTSNELKFAETAARARKKVARTTTSQLMLAKVFWKRNEHDKLLAELADVATWRGRLDEKTEAWLLVCDVRTSRKQWDRALECIHQLESSGTVTPGQRIDVTKRLTTIKEQRTLEMREQTFQELEQRLQKRPPAKP